MWQRFTERARRTILAAQQEAVQSGSRYVGSEHLFLGLLHENEGVAAQVLEHLGITLEGARKALAPHLAPSADSQTSDPKMTPQAKRTLELAAEQARSMKHNYIGTEHLLLALLRNNVLPPPVLEGLGLTYDSAHAQTLAFLGPETRSDDAPLREPSKVEREARLRKLRAHVALLRSSLDELEAEIEREFAED